MGSEAAMATWDEVCAAVQAALPGVEVGSSYGTPALKVRGKMLLRVWPDEPDVLVVRLTDLDEQEELTATEPETFFITPHYAGYAAVLVRIGGDTGTTCRFVLRHVVVATGRRQKPD